MRDPGWPAFLTSRGRRNLWMATVTSLAARSCPRWVRTSCRVEGKDSGHLGACDPLAPPHLGACDPLAPPHLGACDDPAPALASVARVADIVTGTSHGFRVFHRAILGHSLLRGYTQIGVDSRASEC
jgi:hypothetical protein